jgi:hypothetical protein
MPQTTPSMIGTVIKSDNSEGDDYRQESEYGGYKK